MQKQYFILIMAMLGVLLASCINDDITDCPPDRVEISFALADFTLQNNTGTRAATRATEVGTAEDNRIDRITVFLFPVAGSPPGGYPIIYDSKDVIGNEFATEDARWNYDPASPGIVTFQRRPSTVGLRDVCVIANLPDDLALDVIEELRYVQSLDELKNYMAVITSETPWSPALSPPLMTGHTKTPHDFNRDPILGNPPVTLTRAVAKLDITFTIKTPEYISNNAADYKYKYINFDKDTYLFKPETKITIDPVSHIDWVTTWTAFTNNSTTITAELQTYLNERDEGSGDDAAVEIALPYSPGEGALPPPEFGDGDILRLPLPTTITRNTIYRYEIEM